ncbi:MAG: NUDIX hydrolase [Planctomycetota bacterium]|jgi:8-oxo-dGTP pyrophosphatase MutT (NUDIX family)
MKHLWDRRSGEIVYDAGIFRVRKDRYWFRGRPAGHPFHVLEVRPWVNVVPVTPDGEIVLVRQYRHGVEEDCLEIPGGVVDSSDPGPAEAAVRELFEETGYRGEAPRSLGSVSSNPAILTNRTFTYWIPNAEPAGDPEPDEHEALTVEPHSAGAILPLIEEGRIHHALSVVALLRYLSARDT